MKCLNFYQNCVFFQTSTLFTPACQFVHTEYRYICHICDILKLSLWKFCPDYSQFLAHPNWPCSHIIDNICVCTMHGYEKTPPDSVCVFVCVCSKSYLLSNIKFLLSAFGVDIAVNRICQRASSFQQSPCTEDIDFKISFTDIDIEQCPRY